jgi:uncharacterized Zn finger protein
MGSPKIKSDIRLIENYELKVGDVIIMETAEGRFLKKTILEIQLDNKSYPQITIKIP